MTHFNVLTDLKVLVSTLGNIKKIAGSKENRGLTILYNKAIFKSDGRSLDIQSTDLVIGIKCKLPILTGWTEQFKNIVFNCDDVLKSLKAVKAKKGDTVDIVFNDHDQKLIFKVNSLVFKFDSKYEPDYPNLPEFTGSQIMPDHVLDHMIKAGSATATAKSILAGVSMICANNKLTIAATDMYRLYKSDTIHYHSIFNPDFNLIIPGDSINFISKVFKNSKEDLFWGFQDNHIAIKSETICIYSKMIAGKFPDYNRILPKTFEHEINLKKEDLKQLEIFKPLINPQTHVISANLNGKATFYSPCNSDTRLDFEYQNTFDHANLNISFNLNYLLDAINNCEQNNEGNLILKFNSELQSAIIEGQNQIGMVMPIKL